MNQLEIFLNQNSPLANHYKQGMECHCNVAQDDGSIEGKTYYNEFEKWWAFRLSKGKSKLPPFDIGKHAEAIGLTGWNYEENKSYWVGFDFDSIVNHKAGLTEGELNEILERAKAVDWVTVYRSTSGNGFHFYVYFEEPVEVISRSEHSLLSRAILSNLSILLNFDFQSKVDKSGGILWIWHRRMTKTSFECVKEGKKLSVIPKNWKEKTKNKDIAFNIKHVKLLPDQERLLQWFSKEKCLWWWEADMHMLVCHTWDLQRAHIELNFKGLFRTISTGENCPNDQNCFAFPNRDGSWIVRRHSLNTPEEKTWQTDKNGWTYCYLNRLPSLEVLAALFEGQINAKDEWVFSSVVPVKRILEHLSPNSKIDLAPEYCNRWFKIKRIKDSRIVLSFDRVNGDNLIGWVPEKNCWQKVLPIIEEQSDQEAPDELLRHVVSDDKDAGWYLKSRERWVYEPKAHLFPALESIGYTRQQINTAVGQCILSPWELTSIPFGEEYPGDRKWNKFRCRFRFEPKEGPFETWSLILKHLGKGLTSAVQKHSWCKAYDIMTGEDYLKLWLACTVQYPFEPLPYLFFCGQENSGKSIFHESMELIIDKGVRRAEKALMSSQGFNQELAGCIIAVVEEINLSKNPNAYDRIKDCVTSRTLSIHPKGQTPYELPNTTHWVQCANNPEYCPIRVGDTRVVMTVVTLPDEPIPKTELLDRLRLEAPGFIHELMNVGIPKTNERLRLPVLHTEVKIDKITLNANLVEQFILEKCYQRNGHFVSFAQFCDKFKEFLMDRGINQHEWSNIKIAKSIPYADNMPVRGRYGNEQLVHMGNLTFDSSAQHQTKRFIQAGDKIVLT